MRLIDADRLLQVLEINFGHAGGADVMRQLIDEQPTLTPPNEALTLEQLREMGGEPVWIEDVKRWALIDIEKGGQWDGVPFAIWAENGAKFTYNAESRGLHCYRRPPEGEGNA